MVKYVIRTNLPTEEKLETYNKYILKIFRKLTKQWGIRGLDLRKTEKPTKWDIYLELLSF